MESIGRRASVVVRLAALACLALLCGAASASAAADVKINHWGWGAVATYSVCIPQTGGDDLCEDQFVTYGSFGSTRDGRRDVTGLQFERYKALIHPDGAVDEFVAEVGWTEDVDGAVDRARLTYARSGGATLALSDIDPDTGELMPNGRDVTLGPFAWTAASEVNVFGNDGPFGFGLPRHYAARCETLVSNGHERFTAARVTGTIDGVSVDTLGPAYLPWPGTGPDDARGAIFDNRFTVVLTGHAPGC